MTLSEIGLEEFAEMRAIWASSRERSLESRGVETEATALGAGAAGRAFVCRCSLTLGQGEAAVDGAVRQVARVSRMSATLVAFGAVERLS